MSLTLYYHPLSSYCWKVLIALYEAGIAFDARMVNPGDPNEKAAYRALWPTAKIPLLVDGDRVVPETSIMIEHLDRRYPGRVRLIPDDPDQALEVRLWDRLFDCYVMDPMQRHVAQLLRPTDECDARTLVETTTALQDAYQWIDAKLAGRAWAAGDAFSMADCAAAPSLFYAATITPLTTRYPTLADYFERLVERPSVRRVIAEARPYFQYFPLREALADRFSAPD